MILESSIVKLCISGKLCTFVSYNLKLVWNIQNIPALPFPVLEAMGEATVKKIKHSIWELEL